MVTGINTYYDPYQYNMYNNQGPYATGIRENVALFPEQNNNSLAARKDNTADGKDDGSIGFWGATKNMAKGVWNFVTSPFKNDKGEWSLGSTLKSLAIGALFVAGNALTGGALTPILLAGGAVMGTVGAVKAGYNIATAKTDAEAEAAWQSMGSSAATLATTAVGARSYARASAAASGMSEAEINSRYGSILKGTKNSIGKTFVDSKNNLQAGKTYLFGQTAKEAVIKDGTIVKEARPEIQGKVQQKWAQVKDNYNNSSKETWYGKTADVARNEYGAAVEKGKAVLADNSGVYKLANEKGLKFSEMTTKQKAAVVKQLRNSIAAKAKTQLGIKKDAGYIKNAKAVATNPQNIGIHNWLTTQSFKPDFYDSLSKEEQAYFDTLPKEQREQLKDYYYSMI